MPKIDVSEWAEQRMRFEKIAPDTADRCVCCGDVIPEGRQVCLKCEGGGK